MTPQVDVVQDMEYESLVQLDNFKVHRNLQDADFDTNSLFNNAQNRNNDKEQLGTLLPKLLSLRKTCLEEITVGNFLNKKK